MSKSNPLYENIYIGAFIYALGVISGQRGESHTNAFSLIQQTPDDRSLADLFARWEGGNFIIEFKRTDPPSIITDKTSLLYKSSIMLFSNSFSKSIFLYSRFSADELLIDV